MYILVEKVLDMRGWESYYLGAVIYAPHMLHIRAFHAGISHGREGARRGPHVRGRRHWSEFDVDDGAEAVGVEAAVLEQDTS